MPQSATDPQRILDEIRQLEHALAARRSVARPPSGSVVRAYQLLLERQFERLDALGNQRERSINAP